LNNTLVNYTFNNILRRTGAITLAKLKNMVSDSHKNKSYGCLIQLNLNLKVS